MSFRKDTSERRSSYLLVIDYDESQNELLLLRRFPKKIASQKIDSDFPFGFDIKQYRVREKK